MRRGNDSALGGVPSQTMTGQAPVCAQRPASCYRSGLPRAARIRLYLSRTQGTGGLLSVKALT